MNTSLKAISCLRRISHAMKFMVHAYCVMPDHVHFLAEGGARDCNLITFVSRWKQMTGFAASCEAGTRFWQKGFFEHIVRDGGIDTVAWYIWMNPVRARIVEKAEEYPYSGSWTVPWPVANGAIADCGWEPPWKTGADSRIGHDSNSHRRGFG